MSLRPRVLTSLAWLLVVTACSPGTAPPPTNATVPTVAAAAAQTALPATAAPQPPAAATTAAAVDFDSTSVPESTASLPPFPFFKAPDGLTSVLAEADKNTSFDRTHMVAGNKVVAIEGKIFHDQFQLTADEGRKYSDIEFQRNYSDAIAKLGGVKISTSQYTPALWDAFGGRDAVDKHYIGACASDGCETSTAPSAPITIEPT